MLVTFDLPGSAIVLAKWTCWAPFKWAKKALRWVGARLFMRNANPMSTDCWP